VRKVAFELDGKPYEAALLKRGRKTARIGWLEADTPPVLAARTEQHAIRHGWRSMLVSIMGPNAVTLRELPRPRRAGRPGRRAMGVQTAELAKKLAMFLVEQGSGADLQIICSHRGLYQDEREDELTATGVAVRQIAFFIGDDHTAATKAGVSDIAVVTRDEPRRTILLVEIEENGSGTKPKAVIGDGLLPLLADRVDVLQDDGSYFSISLRDAAVWVGYHPRSGYDVSRTDRLGNKLNDLVGKARGEQGVGPGTVRLFNESPERLYDTLLADAKRLLIEWTTAQGANREQSAARA
jgi:hypothetical protein